MFKKLLTYGTSIATAFVLSVADLSTLTTTGIFFNEVEIPEALQKK